MPAKKDVATPEFDFTLERPVNATALEIYDRGARGAQIRTAEQLAHTMCCSSLPQ